MIGLFRGLAWITFVGLSVYVFLYAKFETRMEKHVFLVRKIWYVLFVLGALIYWTVFPKSIFQEWKDYLIVAVFFAMTDAFIFLGLYLRKFGTGELERATRMVEANEQLVEDSRSKVKSMLQLLKDDGVVTYDGGEEEYLNGLRDFLQAYAQKEDMICKILPFGTDAEKSEALRSLDSTRKVQTKLERNEIHYDQDGKVAFYPVSIQTKPYLLKIEAETFVSEIDCSILLTLIAVYDIANPGSEVISDES